MMNVTEQLTEELAHTLENLCDKQLREVSNAELGEYKTLFQQKLAWYREWEQMLKRIKKKKEK